MIPFLHAKPNAATRLEEARFSIPRREGRRGEIKGNDLMGQVR